MAAYIQAMPEKGISDVGRAVREQYEKGVAAIQRDNLDYALAILTAVLRQEPGLYPAREALRDAQLRKAAKKGGFLKKIFGAASASPLLAKAQIELRTNPENALQTAEQILNSDANSVAAHKVVANAAKALDLPKTALFSLQFAFKNAPDKDTALQLSEALVRAGQVAKADAVLSDLAKTFPNDQDIAQALKDLSAKRTLSEGGYEGLADGKGSYRDVLKDKAEAVSLEQEKREVKTADVAERLLQEHQARLAQEPNNTRTLRAMAELHIQREDYDAALATYERIAEVEGAVEPSLHRAITQAALRRYAARLQALDPGAPTGESDRKELEAERDAYELERAQDLVKLYPNDLALHFDLGTVAYRLGRITEAIQEFQKAQNNPHKKVQSLFYLGRCFAQRGIRDVAARTLETAIREKALFDDEKKELLYTLAGVLEEMGRKEDAMEQLKRIYEVDIGYRDVAARVDAFYASGGG
jgi:tetratricopeptide (TPR) repeat protein